MAAVPRLDAAPIGRPGLREPWTGVNDVPRVHRSRPPAARIIKKDLAVATLRRSFATALGMTRILWVLFYERLFAGHAEVRGLFARYLEHQETAFERMLLKILDYLKDGAWLQLYLFALGTRHTNL
jgi:hypothetical protein